MICQAICMKTNLLTGILEYSFEMFSLNDCSSKAAENLSRSEVCLPHSAFLMLHQLCMPLSLWITAWIDTN